jgi:hypothetical protein
VQGEEGIERLVEGQKRNTRERRVLRVCWDSGVFFCKRQRVRERESVFLPGRVSIRLVSFCRETRTTVPSTVHVSLTPRSPDYPQEPDPPAVLCVRDKAENPVSREVASFGSDSPYL